MHEAGVVIVPQLRGQVTEEGADVAALVLHHGHGDAADVQVRKGGLDLRLLISTARRDEDIRLRRELCRKRLAGIQHIHEIQVHGQRNAAVFADALRRCLVQHRRLDDAGQGEIAGKIVRVHRADHVLPDEVHRIVRLVPQIVVQLLHRLTCRVVEIGLQLVHKAAALEQRAFFLPQQKRRADEQRIVCEVLQIVGFHIDIPLEALILKLLGEHSLVSLHRVGVALDHRHVVPVGLQLRVLHKAPTVNDEVRLDVYGQIVIQVLALEGVRLGTVVDG